MSHSKRHWEDLDTTITPPEGARVKRRTISHVKCSFGPNSASDGESSDQDMTSFTLESTSTPSSVVSSISRPSESVGRAMSLATAQSGSVAGDTGDEWPSKRGTCFGMVWSIFRFRLTHG